MGLQRGILPPPSLSSGGTQAGVQGRQGFPGTCCAGRARCFPCEQQETPAAGSRIVSQKRKLLSPTGRCEHKPAKFSKANFLKTSSLWLFTKEARYTCYFFFLPYRSLSKAAPSPDACTAGRHLCVDHLCYVDYYTLALTSPMLTLPYAPVAFQDMGPIILR